MAHSSRPAGRRPPEHLPPEFRELRCLFILSPASTSFDKSLGGSMPVSHCNGTLHERSEVVKDFTPKCGGINRGDTPRVPKAPRGVPEVDPDTRGE